MRSDARKRLTAAREEGCGTEGGVVSAQDEEEWTCLKPGCDLGVDGHSLALVLEHTLYDEPNFTAEDAQDVAERTLTKVARAFGLDDGEPTS